MYCILSVFLYPRTVLSKGIALFSAEIPEHALFIFRVRFSECRGQILFLLQNLQVQHDDRKQRKECRERIEIHQQNADIHKIEPQKCGIAAELINTACDKLGFVLIGDTRTPAVFHADDRSKEDQISEYPCAKTGETRTGRHIVPAECDGEQLRERGAERGNAHKQFYRMDGFLFPVSDLVGPDAVPMLNQHFGKIDSVKQHQNRKRQQNV